MKKILLSSVPVMVFLFFSIYNLSGQFARIYGGSGNDGIIKVIPAGSDYFVLGYTGVNPGSSWNATVSRINASGSVLWTKTLDTFSQWNDGIVTANGDLLVVGTTLPYSTSSQSIMGLINSSGTFSWVRSSNISGREILLRIALNPSPQNSSFPYYILGEDVAGTSRNTVLMCVDSNGNIGWKKKYASSTSFTGRDLEILPNGDLVLTGGVIFRSDNTGQIYNAADIDGQFEFYDISQRTGGGFYAIGSEGGNFSSQLIKFDNDFIPVWQAAIPNLQSINQVWSLGNDIYVTATRSIGALIQGVLLKFRDNGSSPSYLWTKYLKLNETNAFGISPVCYTSFLPPNKIVYSDGRRRSNGYGFDDGLISVSDMDFNTCMTQVASDNFQAKNNLFFSPVPPDIEFVDVLPMGNVTSSALTWSSFDACLTDCDCSFSSMQIHGPNPAQFQPLVCGGAPVTLGCQPGMGYNLTGIWGASCPTIRSIMVNSCSTEQANEFLIIHSGSKGFNVNDLQIDFDNVVNITGPENNDINIGASSCGLKAGNAAMISGCPNVIAAGPGTFIPAGALVIVQTSSSASSGGLYDFSSFCTPGQQVYIISSTCNRSTESFPNFGSGSVTTGLSLAGSCSSAVTYNRASLSNANGDYFIAPSTYGSTGCSAPPANLIQVSSAVQFNWILSGPAVTQSGTFNGSGPYFSLALLPAYFTQPGLYTLTLQGKCGDKICPCTIQFNVNCPDLCPCGPADLQNFQQNVDMGFATSFSSSTCKVIFTPLGLNGCQTVEWQISPFTGPPIGTSIANQNFSYTFPGPGTYNIKMVVTQKKADGTICETFAKTQSVAVTCGPLAGHGDPHENIPRNPDFSENPVAGGLNSGGSAAGWSGITGNPVLLGNVTGSQDGWVMHISGNASSSDLLSSTETVCIPKNENGILTLRLMSPGEPIPGMDIKLGRKPPGFGKLTVQVSSGQGTGCPGANCFTIASLEGWPSDDYNKWFDLKIPFNLSNWATSESCAKGVATVPVRVLIGITTPYYDSQGDGYNRDAMLIDYISFNSFTTGVELPAFQEGAIRLYPNPASGFFTIEMVEAPVAGTIFRVIKPTGQVVLEKQAEAGECIYSFDSGLMPAGLYFVQVVKDGRLVGVEKLVKR